MRERLVQVGWMVLIGLAGAAPALALEVRPVHGLSPIALDRRGTENDAPDAAFDGRGNSVIVWVQVRGGRAQLMARRYDAAGAPRGAVFPIAESTTDVPVPVAVAMNAGGDFIVGWRLFDDTGPDRLFCQSFGRDGRRSSPVLALTGVQDRVLDGPALGIADSGEFLAGWSVFAGALQIVVQRFTAEGQQLGSPVQLEGAGNVDGGPLLAVHPDGSFAVAWLALVEPGGGEAPYFTVLASAFDAAGRTPTGPFRAVDRIDNLALAMLARSPDGYVVAWQGCTDQSPAVCEIKVRLLAPDARPRGEELPIDFGDDHLHGLAGVAADAAGDFAVAAESCTVTPLACQAKVVFFDPSSTPRSIWTPPAANRQESVTVAAGRDSFMAVFLALGCADAGCRRPLLPGLWAARFAVSP
ncbi:MAG TPA: hypothetical protein VJA16_03095 [Thermoanaerobaculia bacterium]